MCDFSQSQDPPSSPSAYQWKYSQDAWKPQETKLPQDIWSSRPDNGHDLKGSIQTLEEARNNLSNDDQV